MVERALRKIGWREKSILGAGRTDTGVHASGQVIAFDMQWNHSCGELRSAINANLPTEISALAVTETSANFHPRFDAVARRYRYHIYHEDVRNPLKERYAWRVWPVPDKGLMQIAAEKFVGVHDFAAFGSPTSESGSTIREVFDTRWFYEGPDDYFEITANAFLYHMVRRIVKLLVQIGQRQVELEFLSKALNTQDLVKVQGLAPAKGLSLVQVQYK